MRPLAEELADAGLREVGIRSRFGTGPLQLARSAQPAAAVPVETLPAALVALFVRGARLDASSLPQPRARLWSRLESAGLVCRADGRVSAPLALLPIERALIACPWDRLPDDSSLHLSGCLPGRLRRWLDVGTGCAFAPLLSLARAPAAAILATDIDRRSLEAARQGAQLTAPDASLTLRESDLFADITERDFDLITFNAPIESADALLERFFADARDHLAPGGEILVHSVFAEVGPTWTAGGAMVRCRYTPLDFAPAFGVTRVWPDAGMESITELAVDLSPQRPHLRRADLEPDGFSNASLSR